MNILRYLYYILLLALLSGCNANIYIKGASYTNNNDVNVANKNITIVATKKMMSKNYELHAKRVHLYPGLINSLYIKLNETFNNVIVIKESDYDANNYNKDSVIVIPNWEIESRKLNTNIDAIDGKSGKHISIEDTVIIEDRSRIRSLLYLMSCLTIVGIPISMNIDKNDITNKVEAALDESTSNLKSKLYAAIIKDTQ